MNIKCQYKSGDVLELQSDEWFKNNLVLTSPSISLYRYKNSNFYMIDYDMTILKKSTIKFVCTSIYNQKSLCFFVQLSGGVSGKEYNITRHVHHKFFKKQKDG